MKLVSFSIVVATAMAVSACSLSSPSESEAENAIRSSMGDCRYISLEHFEKINGIPQENKNTYQVEVKYTINVKVFPDSRQLAEDVLAKLNEVSKDYEEIKAEHKRRWDINNALREKYYQIEQYRGDPQYQQLKNAAFEEKQKYMYEQLNPYTDIASQAEKEATASSRAIIVPLQTKFENECPGGGHGLFPNTEQEPSEFANSFLKNFSKDFSISMLMIKTDNGWVQGMYLPE